MLPLRFTLPRLATLLAAVTLLAVGPLAPAHATAQPPAASNGAASGGIPKKVLGVDDYSRWRSIEGSAISSDGEWVAYVLRHTNVLPADSRPELRLVRLATNDETVIAGASSPEFSRDGRWLVYTLDSVPARGGRGGRGGAAPADSAPAGGRAGQAATPAPRRMELRELATGRTQTWQDMQSAAFSPNSTHLVLRRRAAGGAGGGRGGAAGGGDGAPAPRGTDVLVHDLARGTTQLLGSVGDFAFNRSGELLAYTIDAAFRDGNGLFVLDLASGRPHTLDNDARNYNRMTWNDDGSGIAVLKGREVERMRERNNVLLVIPDVRATFGAATRAAVTLDPANATGFPSGWVVSDRAPLSWSEDSRLVFLGTMKQTATPDTGRRRSTDSVPDVDVWRTQDERIQSVQMVRAEADRNFTFRQAFDVRAQRFVALTDSTMRDMELSLDGRWGVGRDARAYVSDWKPPQADFYRVNTATGERTLMLRGHFSGGGQTLGFSPDGKHWLYWKDGRHHTYEIETGTTRALTATGAPSFTDLEFDYTGPRPSYGVAGFTPDGRSVIVNHRHDLWLLPLDAGAGVATAPRNLTGGAGTRTATRYRPIRTEPVDDNAPRRVRSGREIDLSKPLTLSAFGTTNKKGGFSRLANGALSEIVFDDAAFSTPQRAEKAERFLFTRQTFTEFPDLRVSGADWTTSRKISDANPHHAEYAWGRRIVFDYRLKDGVRLEGILALPDDYKAGEKRPMLVTFYEKNSQNAFRYTSPSFITGMGGMPIEAVSRGYVTMLPDVHFRTGSSHSDMLEAVEAATKKVIEMGYVDPKRIGVHGHSYGGEGAAFIATRSKMFAAVGMGAGVTDLYSDFSQSWGWTYQVTGGSGANGTGYYMTGQGRWGFSPWDRPEVYRNESALTHVRDVSMPVLIMHGTADPTVSFTEGMNFYNALRFNGKNAVMLAYPNEGHGLRGLANRRDLTVRYFQFFDHYLRGAPAPKWISEGVPYLEKDASREAR